VASAALRLLQDAFRPSRLDYSGDAVGLMANHGYDFSRFQRGARGEDMLYEAAATGPMQNLREAGFKPRAFSRGENEHGKIVGRHRSIILREHNQFRNAAI
jgi:hypothetical protein